MCQLDRLSEVALLCDLGLRKLRIRVRIRAVIEVGVRDCVRHRDYGKDKVCVER